MSCQAGVDEAGLGPIVGPLVVAGAAIAGPPGCNPWRALRSLVCRHRAERDKIHVADSKKVNQGERGLWRLEHTALTFWGAWRGALPPTVGALLDALEIDTAPLAECPWYRDLDVALPLCVDPGLLELRAHSLAQALGRARLEVRRITALVLDAKEFNASLAATANKSGTHFAAYSRILADLIDLLPDGGHLVADRCGGRTRYGDLLRRLLPGAAVHTLSERAAESRYEIRRGPTRVLVTFAVQGEDRSFPTALSSCVAKYLRQVMLHLLNRWFCARVPGLKPTEGYYADGRRFVAETAGVLAADRLERALLVRER